MAALIPTQQFIEGLSTYNPDDRLAFKTIISQSLEHGLEQGDIAVEFGLPGATIGRWAAGRSLPATQARGFIIARVGTLLQKQAPASSPV